MPEVQTPHHFFRRKVVWGKCYNTLSMQLLRLLIFIILAIVASAVFLGIENQPTQEVVLAPVEFASSTPTKIATSSLNTAAATTTPPKRQQESQLVPTPKISPPALTPAPAVPSSASDIPLFSFSELNLKARESLVNIICATSAESPLSGESGSGVFVTESGVILTNAHIAQYYLLEDYPSHGGVECTIRTGSPATAGYRARLLYISPRWVKANSESLSLENPSGTGEDDFALLLVESSAAGGEALPSSFPFLPLAEVLPIENTEVLVAGYPAEFLGSSTIQRNLFAISTITAIWQYFTFASTSKDVFSIGNVILAAKGSSGGPVVAKDGTIVGILVTSTGGATTGDRDAFAITTTHIEQSFQDDTGASLLQFLLSKNLSFTAETFENTIAPQLSLLIIAHLPK